MRQPRSAPTFLGIGLQKAATTWLHTQLETHPQVWVPPRKELHFFDMLELPKQHFIAPAVVFQQLRRVARFLDKLPEAEVPAALTELKFWAHMGDERRDLDWYRKIWLEFSDPEAKTIGEITPAYSVLDRKTIEIVRSEGVEKILLLLRDPVERTWSQHRMAAGGHPEYSPTFYQRPHVVARGAIRSIVENWEAVFGQENVFVGMYDSLLVEGGSEALLRSVCDFLGVNFSLEWFPEIGTTFLASTQMGIPAEAKQFLVEAHRADLDFAAERFGKTGEIWRARYL